MSNISKKIITRTLVAMSLLACTSITVQAAPLGETQGYLTNSYGNIVRSGYGACVHNSTWTAKNATIVGCDGVVLDAQIEMVKGEPSGLLAEINLPAASLFSIDSAVLNDEGKQAIQQARDTLKLELTQSYAALIIGHTDSTASDQYNAELSIKRAQSVKDYLVSTGGSADKLRAIGMGETYPIASNNTEEGRAVNRRVEIIIIAELRGLDALRFPSVALFPERSAELTAQGRTLLDRNRADARSILNRATYIEVVGHTDDGGDDDYNLNLSLSRAESVRDYLISKGLNPNQIGTVGMGENSPIASNNTEEGRAQNRRVEVFVLGRAKQ